MITKPTVSLLSHTQIADPRTFVPAFREWVAKLPEDKEFDDKAVTVLNGKAVKLFESAEGGTEPEQVIEFAGRACYQSFHRPTAKTDTIPKYIKNILGQGHESVLEHSSATFYIEGISRNLTHELIRHRHLNYSQLSQRFVNESGAEFVLPPAFNEHLDDTHIEGLDEATEASRDVYEYFVDYLQEGKGLPRKQAREAARSILPGNTETKIVVTGNFRAWRDMLKKRLDPAADAEIRNLSEHILSGLLAVAPSVFEDIYEEFYG